MSYYRFPIVSSHPRPINVFESKDNDWTFEYITKKCNNNSLMCWYKCRQDDVFDFRCYEVRKNTEGALKGFFRNYKFNQGVVAEANVHKVECLVLGIWELRPN